MRTLLDTTTSFLSSEDGAVTVDWVVLTAALVGLGLAAMAVVSGGVEDLSGDVSVELASIEVGGSLFSGSSSGPTLTEWTPVLQQGADQFAADALQMSDQAILDLLADMTTSYGGIPPREDGAAYDTYYSMLNEAETRGIV